mgnify:CR=1 FL=1
METSNTRRKWVKRLESHKIYPLHPMVNMYEFNDDQEEEANLADAIAHVAVKNGLSNNDTMHLFPVIMRILKDKSAWGQ